MAQGWSMELPQHPLWIGQLLQTPGMSEAQAVVPLSGSQIAVTVIAGLIMAFAFQLLLANLGLALGVTLVSFRPKPKPDLENGEQREAQSNEEATAQDRPHQGKMSSVIGVATGFSLLLTVNLVLLAACFLAVKLSWAQEPILGAILGILIWSAYLLVLTGLSSAAIGSMVGQLLGSATSGIRRLLIAVQAVFDRASTSPMPVIPSDLNQTIRQEVDAAFAALDLKSELQTYLQRLQHPAQQPAQLRSRFMQLLTDPTQDVSVWQVLDQLDRQTLLDWVQRQTDWPDAKAAQLVDELEAAWQQVRDRQEDTQPDAIATVLDVLKSKAASRSPAHASESNGSHPPSGSKAQALLAPLDHIDPQQLMRSALNRVDWSDWDVETLWHRIQALQPQSDQSTDEDSPDPPKRDRPFSVLRLDVEDYLLSAYTWNLNPERLAVEFREVLHDPEADPQQAYEQVIALEPSDWLEPLRQRDDLEEPQVEQIANWLEAVRQEVLRELQDAMGPVADPTEHSAADQDEEAIASIQDSLESYLRYTNLKKLTDENIQQKLQSLTQDWVQSDRALPELKVEALEAILKRRRKLKSKRRHQIMKQLQTGWADLNAAHSADHAEDRPDTETPQSMPQRLKAIATQSLQRVGSSVQQVVRQPKRWRLRQSLPDVQTQLRHYLRHQKKSAFTPAAIQQDLAHLLEDAQTQLAHLAQGLAEQADETTQTVAHVLPDWSTTDLLEVLSERQDITVQEAQAIAHQVKQTGQRLCDRALETEQQAESALNRLWQTIQTIQHHLDAIDLPDLQPEQLQQDLSDILQRPQTGLVALKTSLTRLLKERSLSLDLLPLEALQDKLTQLTQEALSTVGEIPSYLSEQMVNHLKDQLEALQEQVFQQVEQVQTELQSQVEAMRRQVQDQAEAARKMAAIAAWWLFSIAFTSGMTAAIAGILAVSGLEGLSPFWHWLAALQIKFPGPHF